MREGLSLADLSHTVRAVWESMRDRGCPVFDKRIPTDGYFENYFACRDNLHLERNYRGLPSDALGVTAKRKFGKRSLFVVLVSPIRDDVVRLFTVAHEVGHILLHGRLLSPKILTPRRWNSFYVQENRLRGLMELEANIWALFCLIPTKLIEIVEEHGNSRSRVASLQQVATELYGSHVDAGLVDERLLIHELNRGGGSIRDPGPLAYEHYRRLAPDSWLLGGVSSVKRRQERKLYVAPRALARDELAELTKRATDAGITADGLSARQATGNVRDVE